MSKIATGLVCIVLVLLAFPEAAVWGQATERFDATSVRRKGPLRDFRNTEDEILVSGDVEKLDGGTVTIKSETGELKEFRLAEFCEEDRQYIRREATRLRKFAQDQEQAKELVQELGGGFTGEQVDVARQVRICNRLRKLGMAANIGELVMRDLLDHPDERLKRAAASAFLAICEPTDKNLELIVNDMRSEQFGLREAFENYPDELFEEMLRFRDFALPYFQHAAYTGRLKLTSSEPKVTAEPERFLVEDGQRDRIRAAACEAIGKLGDSSGVNVLVDLLPAVESRRDESRDRKSLEAIIVSLGQLGYAPDAVVDAFQRLEQEFPEAIAKAKDEIREKIRAREDRDDD